jgi:3-oxoacyl-[acyl-carrier-protein] synthase II
MSENKTSLLSSRRPGQPLAITGMGCVSAAGVGLAAQQRALAQGTSHIAPRPDCAFPIARTAPVGLVTERLPALKSRTQALALAAAREAFQHSGLSRAQRHDFAVVVGSCTGGMPESEAVFLTHGQQAVSPIYKQQHPHRTTQLLSHYMGVHGPQSTHALACASAAAAMIETIELVRSGLCPGALVVGADALTRVTLAGFTSLMLVDPHGCRPLTNERAGMSLGEAGAAFIIEHPDFARARGANIMASVLGWGQYADAYHLTSPEPSGAQLERAIHDCLADSGITPTEVGYVNAHGTGTRDNDQVETSVLSRVFGAIPSASSKRTFGHTMGAAAAVEGIACCLGLMAGKQWASSGAELGTPMSGIDLLSTTRDSAYDIAVSTTLAFGGINACLSFARGERCL